jgi:hypothetical protein
MAKTIINNPSITFMAFIVTFMAFIVTFMAFITLEVFTLWVFIMDFLESQTG